MIPFLAASLALATAPSGFVYSAGYGPAVGKPLQSIAEAGPVQGLGPTTELACGQRFTLGLRPDGTVMAWGENSNGVLGQGLSQAKMSASATPLAVPLPPIKSVGAGAGTAFAVATNGDLYAWGGNFSKQFTYATFPKWHASPLKLPVTGVASVTGGLGHVLALMQDGTVVSWGSNAYGQLGVGDQLEHGPQTIPNLDNVVQVASCGYRSFAVKSDGTVWAWGLNASGQLGVAGGTYILAPTQISGLSLINSISTSNSHAVAVRDDGMILTWGGNSVGQLGIPGVSPTYAGVPTPTPVTGLPFIKHAAAAGDTTMAADVDGKLWIVGRTDGFTTEYKMTEWWEVPNVPQVVAVAGGEYHNLAISQTETPIWLHFDPYTIVAGRTKTTLKLHLEAPLDRDLVLPIEKADDKLILPPTITIPAGELLAQVPVRYQSRVKTWRSPKIFIPSGGVRAAGMLNVSPDTLTLSFFDWPQAGDATGGTIRINFPAPEGGFSVSITCEDPSSVTFPASVTIPAGKEVAVLPVQTTPCSTQRFVNFSVVGGPLIGSSDLVIQGNPLGSISFNPREVYGGTKVELTALVPDPAPVGGITVNLLQGGDHLVIPSTMVVPEGQTSATILVGTRRQPTPVDVPITAYVQGSYAKVGYVKLLAAMPLSLIPSDENPVGGSTVQVKLTLTGPSTGHTIPITSSDPLVSVPATVSVPAGAKTVTFDAVTSSVSAPASVTLRAKLNGGLATCRLNLKLAPPALASIAIAPNEVTGGAVASGTVTLASPAPTGGAFVYLKSSAPKIAPVPYAVRVAAGKTTASFDIQTAATVDARNVTVTGSVQGVDKKANLKVNPF